MSEDLRVPCNNCAGNGGFVVKDESGNENHVICSTCQGQGTLPGGPS